MTKINKTKHSPDIFHIFFAKRSYWKYQLNILLHFCHICRSLPFIVHWQEILTTQISKNQTKKGVTFKKLSNHDLKFKKECFIQLVYFFPQTSYVSYSQYILSFINFWQVFHPYLIYFHIIRTLPQTFWKSQP